MCSTSRFFAIEEEFGFYGLETIFFVGRAGLLLGAFWKETMVNDKRMGSSSSKNSSNGEEVSCLVLSFGILI